MARLLVHKRAAKVLSGLEPELRGQILDRLEALAADPGTAPGVKPMQGEWRGYYRVRHGDWRLIYLWDRAADTILVAHAGPRGDVYK
jgi:mRNA interferase RelE/StbE